VTTKPKPLRRLQDGENLSLPHSRPMPGIGPKCHELRVSDRNHTWRIVYYLDADAVVILDVFAKQSRETPNQVIDAFKLRLKRYQDLR